MGERNITETATQLRHKLLAANINIARLEAANERLRAIVARHRPERLPAPRKRAAS